MLLQLKIQIQGISKPPVWRRLVVPAQFTFEKLHLVIQAAFGWFDCHLYQFSPTGYGSNPRLCRMGEDIGWDTEDMLDANTFAISEILNTKGQKFTYIYDFGDDWIHKITVEEVLESKAIRAELLAGKGACPPENCGGIWGYERFRAAINDPKHPEYIELREWLYMEEDEFWNANYFDLEEAKSEVVQV